MSALDANHRLAAGWLRIESGNDWEADELFINIAQIVQVSAEVDMDGGTIIKTSNGTTYGVAKPVQEVLAAIGAVNP